MFILTNEEYSEGLQVNEYNGKYQLIAAKQYEAKGGEIKNSMKYCLPQTTFKEYSDKGVPMQVVLGVDKDKALRTCVKIMAHLMGNKPREVLESMLKRYKVADEVPFDV